jgi:ABC-type Fe3+ transport system substrate-binding protein
MIDFFNVRIIVLIGAILLASGAASAQSAKPGEWEKTVELAKKEGKVVVSIPASTELRAAIERSFENRYGIDVEPVVGRASAIVRKIVDESKAGVRYVDLHMGGSESLVTGMLPEGILEPIEPLMLLSEVRDPKQWWGGHIWVDNAKKFIYSTQAFQTENLWINTQMMKADQVRSFDDLLDERLRDRIGMLDPRAGGSGSSTWSYLREIKGEEYLK